MVGWKFCSELRGDDARGCLDPIRKSGSCHFVRRWKKREACQLYMEVLQEDIDCDRKAR